MVRETRSLVIVLVVLMMGLWPTSSTLTPADAADDGGRGPMETGGSKEWMCDFTNLSMVQTTPGIDVDDGSLSLTLQRGRGGLDEYEPYPTVMVFDNNDLKFYRSNANRTDYLPLEMIDVFRSNTAKYCDMDLDGNIDMLLQDGYGYPNERRITICWGDGPESWDLERATYMDTAHIMNFDLGDFNGDGWPDIAYSASDPPDQGINIFLNRGHGVIASQPDIHLPTQRALWMATGDLNSDGFDDTVLVQGEYPERSLLCFLGGPNGPDTTPDIEFEADTNVTGVKVFDIDGDDNLDVLTMGAFRTYLGGPEGPDNVEDMEFLGKLSSYAIGDIDNDGHFDIVSNAGAIIRIFNGSDQGLNETQYHEITGPGLGGTMSVIDIDRDGCDDILLANETKFKVVLGQESGWPSAPSLSLDVLSVGTPSSITAAVHRSNSKGFYASFTTEPITLPPGTRWDILDLDGTMPANTSVSITVLNETMGPIPGYTNLTDWNLDLTDLSGHRTIHVKVHITSHLGVATPTLDRLLVNWMDEDEWREQFFGTAKVDGLVYLEVRDDQLQRPIGVVGNPNGSYLSKAFGPEDPDAAGNFHTLRCTARLGADQSATLQLLDSTTLETLAEVTLVDGANQWSLEGMLRLRYHPEIRVRVEAGGLDRPGDLAIDDVWLNWTERRLLPPRVVDSGLSSPTVHRTQGVDLWVEVYDEYDLAEALDPRFEHRLEGETEWSTTMMGSTTYQGGLWNAVVTPPSDAQTGTYRFRVNVTDTEGNFSGAVELPSRLEVLSHLPTGPQSLVATAGDARVDLDWSPPVDEGAGEVLSYRVFRGTSETSLDPLVTLDASARSYEDLEVTNGATYYYAILARNALGDGPLGDIVDVTPLGLPGAPGSLTYDLGDENVTLSWSAPLEDGGARITAYNVFRGEGPGALELVGELEPTVTVYVDEDVSAGSTYRYSVTAVNDVGEGPFHPIVQVIAVGRPEAPTGLVAKEGRGSVSLSWDAPGFDGGSVITGYIVLRGTTDVDLIEVTRVNALVGYKDGDVESGNTYYYSVAATNILGEGPRSGVVEVSFGEPAHGDPAIEPNYVVAASMLVLVGIGAVVASTESFKYWWGLSVVPLFTRIRKEGVLDNKTRLAIHGLVVENPGMHYSAILREFELSNGAAAYHLDVLERENFVRSVRDGRLKRFFSTETKITKEHGMTPEEMREAILDLVREKPGISQKEIVYELGTSRDSTGYFLREMVKAGTLEASRRGKYTIYRYARMRPRR